MSEFFSFQPYREIRDQIVVTADNEFERGSSAQYNSQMLIFSHYMLAFQSLTLPLTTGDL